eukprot:sb/3464271/
MSFLSPNSPQVASSGGSTRNKIALKPGHSLMDWVRFKNRLIPDRPRRITPSELALHNKPGDVWTAIHGAIYDITSYVDYHPGGVDELMKGAGIDSTDLFNQVHKWVNFQNMLKECLVGYLVSDTTAVKPSSKSATLAVPQTVPIPEVSFSWDSYQTDRGYTLIVYGRVPFSNKIRQSKYYGFAGSTECQLVICCQDKQYSLNLTYHEPCSSIQIRHQNLKFELCLFKTEQKLWPSDGQHANNSKRTLKTVSLVSFTATVGEIQKLNHDCYLITFRYDDTFVADPPLGSHVFVHTDNEMVDKKPYTVFSVPDNTSFQLYVKRYPDSLYSSYLTDLTPGTSVQFSGFDNQVDLNKLHLYTEIVMLAAGTGITPFNRILEELSGNNHFSSHTCTVLFYNKTQSDIAWKGKEGGKCKIDVKNILSQEEGEWDGKRGRVCADHFADKIKDALFLVCGPAGFMDSVRSILNENKVQPERVIEFKG